LYACTIFSMYSGAISGISKIFSIPLSNDVLIDMAKKPHDFGHPVSRAAWTRWAFGCLLKE
jgi:hypothetical protein